MQVTLDVQSLYEAHLFAYEPYSTNQLTSTMLYHLVFYYFIDLVLFNDLGYHLLFLAIFLIFIMKEFLLFTHSLASSFAISYFPPFIFPQNSFYFYSMKARSLNFDH